MKACSAYFAIVLFVFSFTGLFSVTAHAKDSLVLAVHPFLSPDQVQKKFAPLAQYLSQQTGFAVKVRVGSSYKEHIEYIGTDKVDIAYMGPASFVSLLNSYGAKPILAKLEVKGRAYFFGNIITRKDSGLKTLADLKDKKIAFGNPNSTMSYIVPHHMLHQANVFTGNSVKHDFLQSHDNVALGVLSGDFDAGAVKPAVFEKFKAQGLATIALTPKISEHIFVTRNNLPTETIDALRQAMLMINQSNNGVLAMHAIKKSITGLVGAKSSDYDNLRKVIFESKTLH